MIIMNRRGMTLIEVIMVLVLGGILLLAMTAQFIADVKFRRIINDQIAISQEAAVAVNHMTRTLRFAVPDSIQINTFGPSAYQLTATIEPGHLAGFTTNKQVTYQRWGDPTIRYLVSGANLVIIARNIASFVPSWDPATKELTLTFTVTKGSQSVTISTKIYVLPD